MIKDLIELRGPYIGGGGRFEAAGDKDDGEPPPCSVRASWQRRELGDTQEDEDEMFQGQVASGRGLGGTDLAEARCGCRRAAKALTAVLQGTRAAWRDAVRGGVCGAALWRGQNQVRDVSARAWHVQNACSARAQSTHGTCSTKCQCMPQGLGEVGT